MSKRQQGCPIEVLMHAIGGKYKPVILYYLMEGPQRFGVLSRLVPGVSQRMLTQHLRELEADGLVHREIYREVPPRVEYSLTEVGKTLEPVLLQMNAWAEQHRDALGPQTAAATGATEEQAGRRAGRTDAATSERAHSASRPSVAPGVADSKG